MKHFVLSLACLCVFILAAGDAKAKFGPDDLAKLTTEQKQRLLGYLDAHNAFNRRAAAYWNTIETKRAERRRKTTAGNAITPADYVTEHPPVYDGPPKPLDVYKLLEKPGAPPPRQLPNVADFLRHAEEQYGFKPLIVSEEEFKRRYAAEALRLGFSQDQIVGIYAFETGGYGVYDMQSGYNPVTKKTKPVSSALGYAQLLHANSAEMLRKHGPRFISRLEGMAVLAGANPQRSAHLRQKSAVLKAMLRDVRKIADGWKSHLAFGASPKGLAVHTLNLDADVGPWLQIEKLDSIRKFAAARGRFNFNAAQLEMLNLAGPARGFEMLQPPARDASTANFFERQGYERNPVVHKRTASELFQRIAELMEKNRAKDGSRMFDMVFEKLMQN